MVNVYGFILEKSGSTDLAMLPTALMGLLRGVIILMMARSGHSAPNRISETRA